MEDIERAAVLGRRRSTTRAATGAGRSLADHPLRGAVHGQHRRRRGRGGQRRGAARRPPGDRSKGVNGYVLNTITPETDKTCLYFWAFARNYCLGEQRLTHELREGVAGIFREDELILEAQQRAIDERPELQLLQPQHRRRRDVGAPADRPDGRGREHRARRPSRSRCARSVTHERTVARAATTEPTTTPAARRRSRPSCALREMILGGELRRRRAHRRGGAGRSGWASRARRCAAR